MKLAIASILGAAAVVAGADAAHADAPKELAELSRAIGDGTTACTGTALGKQMTASRASHLEMGGVWMHDTVDAKLGSEPFRYEVYTSWDPNGKHFHRVMIESDGNLAEGEGHAAAGSAIDFQLDTHGPRGDGLFREHIDWSDGKAVKSVGEVSADKGKSWVKIYELACRR